MMKRSFFHFRSSFRLFADRRSMSIEAVDKQTHHSDTRCHGHAYTGKIQCSSSSNYLYISRKLRPSSGYMYRKIFLGMLNFTTNLNIIKIGSAALLMNIYRISLYVKKLQIFLIYLRKQHHTSFFIL
ncbi:uncharacterized protein LOC122577410 [Bombus pyrosoma]|uniref:uncharacterized protein LOC122577410 n=1 Tax=Bombus pyrosoma TaxID=396416 RepID=UPI001CB8B223|nr:uncharacterized protein LOC122577410 [Bombus pyrosoma]